MKAPKPFDRKTAKNFLKPGVLIVCFVLAAYSFAGQMLTTPVTTFGLSLGLSGLALGMIQNGCEFICMAGRPLAGYCMDHRRKKLALVLGFSLMIVAALLYAFSENPFCYGVARLFQGFVTAFLSSVAATLLPSMVPQELLGTATSVSTAMSSLGAAYAPALSRRLFVEYGFQLAYLAAATASAAVLLLVLRLKLWNGDSAPTPARPAPGGKHTPRLRQLFSGLAPSLAPVCTIGLFANITKDINDYYTVQLGLDRGIDVTTGMAVAGTLAVFIGVLAGLLIDKVTPAGVLIPAFLALAFSNFLYASAATTAAATAAAILYRVGIGCYWPALLVQCCRLLPERRGAAVATVYFFLDMVSLINNTLLGGLYDLFGVVELYRFAGIVNLLAIVYYLLLNKFYLSGRQK